MRHPHRGAAAVCAAVLAGACLAVAGCAEEKPRAVAAERAWPLVIAHRGAAGYLPEHSLAAYAMSHGLGADYIETDILMTRDRALIALHDIRLDYNTDVSQVFPDRARRDGHWYAADFDLAEIRRLSVRSRREGRYRQDSKSFRIPTFEEILDLVQELNRLTGRSVGLYPETKFPAFHERNGLPLEEAMLEVLNARGLRGPEDPVYLESFEAGSLLKLRSLGARQRLVQLISHRSSYDEMVTEAGLDAVAEYASAVGLHKQRIISDPGLVARARERGLPVHAFTFRADALPEGVSSFDDEIRSFYVGYGVDGIFTDHTDRVLEIRSALFGRGRSGS